MSDIDFLYGMTYSRIPKPVCWVSSVLVGSLLGEKASRGSKWVTLKAAKKYLSMPVHEGSLPEEVCGVISVTFTFVSMFGVARVLHRGFFSLTYHNTSSLLRNPLGRRKHITINAGWRPAFFLWADYFQVAVLAAVAAKRKSGGSDSLPPKKRKVIVYPKVLSECCKPPIQLFCFKQSEYIMY